MLERIFKLLQEGHPDALELIYARYHRKIFWLGKDLIRDEFVIESLLQDTFLKLWDKRDTIERPEHIYFFLRYVMKRECTFYYCRPKNHFYRSIFRLESYPNYQDFMYGYDPEDIDEHLLNHEAEQKALDSIKNLFPLLPAKRKHLMELCIKYGFQYKAISLAMGTSITQIVHEVRKAIEELKDIIHKGSNLESEAPVAKEAKPKASQEQEKVLQLRLEKQFSFSDIANELNLSQKEVHKQFMIAYKLMQAKHEKQLESA